MELTEIHPGIFMIYYLILALFAFLYSNPYFMITFIVLMLFLIYLQGISFELKNVMKLFIPMAILIIIINPIFIKDGFNRIYIWGNYFITYEACIYGVIMCGTFFLVLLTLSSYNKSVSYQEMLYIISKKFPIISMILVMALRFIPLLNTRAVEVNKLLKLNSQDYNSSGMDFITEEDFHKSNDLTDFDDNSEYNLNSCQDNMDDGEDNNCNDIRKQKVNSNINLSSNSKILNRIFSNKRFNSIMQKAIDMGHILAVTVSWSLEEAMFTAKSMKARGYHATRRTSYLSYDFNRADVLFSGLIIVCLIVLIYGLMHGVGYINIYPKIDFSFNQLPLNIYYFTFVVFLLPLIYLELREVFIWH